MKPVQGTPEAAKALPYAQPADHPEHQTAGPCFKPTGPRRGQVNQDLKSRLLWVGYVIRKEDILPTQLMFGELTSGKQKQGRPLKSFKYCVKAGISFAEINPKELETHAHDRTGWRALSRRETDTFEERRCTQIEEARKRRKADAPGDSGLFSCPHCPRTCKSRIGLHSHLCALGRREQR